MKPTSFCNRRHGGVEGFQWRRSSTCPDFFNGVVSTNSTVQVGQSQTVTMTVTPIGGYIGAISVSCQNPHQYNMHLGPHVSAAVRQTAVLQTDLTVFLKRVLMPVLCLPRTSIFISNSLLSLLPCLFCYLCCSASEAPIRKFKWRLWTAVWVVQLGLLCSVAVEAVNKTGTSPAGLRPVSHGFYHNRGNC